MIAGALKGLLMNVKKFASLFDLQEKKEVLSNALALQSTVRALIGIVKDMLGCPSDAIARASLMSNCQQYADTITKFYKSCEGASVEHAVNATNNCMEAVGKMLQAEDLDALNAAVDTVANACVKVLSVNPSLPPHTLSFYLSHFSLPHSRSLSLSLSLSLSPLSLTHTRTLSHTFLHTLTPSPGRTYTHTSFIPVILRS